jgi:hypothetical protein
MEFRAPKIIIRMTACEQELNPELGLDDPYDIGIFSMQKAEGEIETQTRLVFEMVCENFLLINTSQKLSSEIIFSMNKMKVQEKDGDLKDIKFSTLVKSDSGMRVNVKRISRDSQLYANEDMNV